MTLAQNLTERAVSERILHDQRMASPEIILKPLLPVLIFHGLFNNG